MNDRVSQSIKSQLDKLEKISNQISLLISTGEYGVDIDFESIEQLFRIASCILQHL